MSLTLTQWQQCSFVRTTRLSKTNDAFKCHGCHKNKTPSANTEVVICMVEGTVSFFCVSCWHSIEWTCPGCDTCPPDDDVVECSSCAQWTHINCRLNDIDIADTYICFDCQTSDVVSLKACVFDKNVELDAVKKQVASQKKLFNIQQSALEAKDDLRSSRIEKLVADNDRVALHNERLVEQCAKSTVSLAQIQKQNTRLRKTQVVLKKQVADNDRVALHNERLVEQCAKSTVSLAQIQKQNTRLRKTQVVLKKQVTESHKRERTNDGLWDIIDKVVKKSRAEWCVSTPIHFGAAESRLWGKYGCKWRSYGGGRQYIAKIKDNEGKCPRFENLKQLFSALRGMKQ